MLIYYKVSVKRKKYMKHAKLEKEITETKKIWSKIRLDRLSIINSQWKEKMEKKNSVTYLVVN